MSARVGLLLAAVLVARPCRADLVHHYPFTVDASDVIGGAHGALIDGAEGFGGVLTLDGTDDYVQIGRHTVPTSATGG
jgi:hypothetical protein